MSTDVQENEYVGYEEDYSFFLKAEENDEED